MSRAPIQVPHEIKDKLDNLKANFFVSSIPAAIDKLIEYYNRNEQDREVARRRQAADMLDVGPETKEDITHFRKQMGFISDSHAVAFLLAHYEGSDHIRKDTFALYRELR